VPGWIWGITSVSLALEGSGLGQRQLYLHAAVCLDSEPTQWSSSCAPGFYLETSCMQAEQLGTLDEAGAPCVIEELPFNSPELAGLPQSADVPQVRGCLRGHCSWHGREQAWHGRVVINLLHCGGMISYLARLWCLHNVISRLGSCRCRMPAPPRAPATRSASALGRRLAAGTTLLSSGGDYIAEWPARCCGQSIILGVKLETQSGWHDGGGDLWHVSGTWHWQHTATCREVVLSWHHDDVNTC
jgi:hypothetical protein